MLLGATGTRSRRERPANGYDDASTMIRAGAKRDQTDAVHGGCKGPASPIIRDGDA